MVNQKYRDYFNIDENYFPCVNESAINNGIKWQDFFPHTTFIELLKKAERMLSRQEKRSLWISGAYGTGKSYSAFALSNILSCSIDELIAYFDKYTALSDYKTDLMQKLVQVKNEGKIITGYRYSSSDLHSSTDLIIALQSEISKIVSKNNLEYKGENTLKNSILKWLDEPHYKQLFTSLITNKYKDRFGGWTTDNIINVLRKNDDNLELISKINYMACQENIGMLKMDMDDLISYIKDIINRNNLKAIVFVLDEFSEFFENNRHELTAFQKLVETCSEMPFYLVVVSHQMEAYFNERDASAKKIKDRFMPCNIEMPNNIAFDLMKDAMKIKEDLKDNWNRISQDLITRTTEARKEVNKYTGIQEEVLKGILPLHPLTAFLLKFISESFESNQRSMFDFIKNNDGSEAFQWYIDNHGPMDNEGKLLTVDLLWDFFYEKGKDNLALVIRNILDTYKRSEKQGLLPDEKIVLKTVLIMQAVSSKLNDEIDLFIATEKNLSLCFNGTDLEHQSIGIVNKLTREEILYKKKTAKGEDWYVTAVMAGDMLEVGKRKEEKIKNTKTSELITDELKNNFRLIPALKMRFGELRFVSYLELTREANELNNKDEDGNFYAIIGVVKDNNEEVALRNLMKDKATELKRDNIVFIDTIATPFGMDALSNYAEYIVSAELQQGKDNAAMRDFQDKAKAVIKNWGNKIYNNKIIIYSKNNPNGASYENFQNSLLGLKEVVENKYPCSFDFSDGLTETMFLPSQLKVGSECGLSESTKGVFGRQEKILDTAWKKDKYWEIDTLSNVSTIKTALDKKIKEELDSNSKISIKDILTFLQDEYGFVSSNLYAFITGFLLKEYANDRYRYSDDKNNEKMSIEKMKEIIDEGYKEITSPSRKYDDKYIRVMSEQEEQFCKLISYVFNIDESLCVSVEDTVRRSRNEVKKLGLPIWILKENADTLEIDFLDEFIKLLNSSEENNSVVAGKIGRMVQNDNTILGKLKNLITKDNIEEALYKYLEHFENGKILELTKELNIGNRVINDIKNHFNSDDSEGLWLWNVDTGNEEIKKVINEYEFIKYSNEILNSSSNSFDDTIKNWQDKLKFTRISYELLDSNDAINMLVNIVKHNFTKNSGIEFAKIIKDKINELKTIINESKNLFKSICSDNLKNLSDDDITAIYDGMQPDLFAIPRADYNEIVSKKIAEYKSNLKSIKLKKLWLDKTETENPRKWSEINKTPILLCVPYSDYPNYKRAFSLLNATNPTFTETEIETAIQLLEKPELFEIINNRNKADEIFKEKFLKQYKNILTNLDDIRNKLTNFNGVSVYDWYDNPSIEEMLKRIAEKQYKDSVKNNVISKIDKMNNETLKAYIKKLLENNMNLGIELLDNSED